MNFDDAVDAHIDWRFKLRQFMENRGDALDPALVAKDDQCILGRWIDGEGSKYSSFPEYALLKREHANFHKYAAEVVIEILAGNKERAEALIDAGSSFAISSTHVTNMISKLRRQVESG